MKTTGASRSSKTRGPARAAAEEAALLDALCGIRDAALMKRVMHELLTPGEYASVRKRWIILRMLKEGHTQREVARAIGGSLCNVTRGARILRTGESVTAFLATRSASGVKGGKEDAY